jgi:hypothetical protein
MATYREIQAYVETTYGFIPHTCWIAEVKELCRIPHLREAPNRIGKERAKSNRCPKTKIDPIKEALKHFKMIQA